MCSELSPLLSLRIEQPWEEQSLPHQQVFFFFFGGLLHWVLVTVCRLCLVVVSWGYSLLQGVGFSLQWLLSLQSTGSRLTGFIGRSTWTPLLRFAGSSAGSVAVAHGLGCSVPYGIFLDQGLNSCPHIGRQILNPWTMRQLCF